MRESRRYDFRLDDAETDGLTLRGYAAVFNQVTDIIDWRGEYQEIVRPGAFKRTLDHRTPVMQFDHGTHPVVGSIPIGSIRSIGEDAHGLHVEARLHDNWLVEPVRDAIRSGSIDGMSFAFEVVDDNRWGGDGLREIREVKLYELGPVVFPAYEGTTVGVRAQQMADALIDPDLRQQIAYALLARDLGTSPGEPAGDGTSPDEPASDDPGPLDAEHPEDSRKFLADAATWLAEYELEEVA